MDFGIGGKVAMVAAASKGIGLSTAKLLIEEGCSVSICARNEEVLGAASDHLGEDCQSYVVDVSNPEDLAWWVDQTRSDLGPIDILVTNTGGPPAGPWEEMTDEQWLDGFNSTLMNIVRLSRLVVPDMRAKGWGRIVHVTSLVAKEPTELLPISSTLRSGIMALTKLQAQCLAPYGITVNGVLPGHTMTDRQTHLAEVRAQRDKITVQQALDLQADALPAKRMADPSEIASAIVFLCSGPASYVNGASLLVDGGLTRAL